MTRALMVGEDGSASELREQMRYRTIAADPPWEQGLLTGGRIGGRPVAKRLPYPTMSTEAIAALPVAEIAQRGCHLWLWTTNRMLRSAFMVMESWGFTYLTTVTWVKPSGFGAWFANTTQHVLFGYFDRCEFPGRRYAPTHFEAKKGIHSAKPDAFYDLVEQVSPEPRLELFARSWRPGWDVWGNEVVSDIHLTPANETAK